MKNKIYIALAILLALPVSSKIEILDRVAIIVGEGVVLESQVKDMLENIEKTENGYLWQFDNTELIIQIAGNQETDPSSLNISYEFI